ncbi:hypothetical protein G6F46_009261 [Rhizopus delemar]|uniref:Large ribosomal subunit protein eL24-related N-terminal domain-containing protein n=2 Tax=Rhizopus TaxID=4842 RepID=A0A9P6Z1Z5_9FUNG|nr:hypothetical protein G6F55_005693 [Rhizopus delemar]KAG1539025.1 hypothetical protein G6F51_009398 [Rhizopus arrhizus]KAG1496959.1 hypothetical protein G6F54_006108 [Rhizopus delemar]KAG1515694.1 hypothetical protein G6F53_002733 [Rhizopus delemar]KAG1525956.1 hypothetical protein G6F52_002867 [Rhizopus delemar]
MRNVVANKEAIQLSSEFLRLFVVEAVHRSSAELEAMSIASQTTNKKVINVEALERILPQLFTPSLLINMWCLMETTFRFINGKTESYFLQRLNPRKIRWTAIYRRLNKKGMTEEVQKKRSRRTVKHERAVVGASWDAIRAKRNQKPDARAAARQAAIAKSKEAKKSAAAAKKANPSAASQSKVSKQQAKGFAPKAAATSR